ncbi:MAG: arsenate reductase ArsC [Pseudomonadota bacterium]|nr:arsenate reductase ArsC [Pseudomonadota bacterium]
MKVLFICTHNRCRSILAEAITNHESQGRILAKSAGSSPVGEVHPKTLKYLNETGIETEGLCSESWDAHEGFEPDVVITVCDSAAGEACPVWFGQSLRIHWGVADPSKIEDETAARAAFLATIDIFRQRIKKVLDTDFENLSEAQLESLFNELATV